MDTFHLINKEGMKEFFSHCFAKPSFKDITVLRQLSSLAATITKRENSISRLPMGAYVAIYKLLFAQFKPESDHFSTSNY